MRLKTTREKRILRFKTTTRWIVYYLLIIFSFVIMTSGSWKKPILLVPIALCIAIGNDQMLATYTGAFCGFLIDIACGRLFGYNAVLLSVFCAGVSLIHELYLRRKFINYLVVTVVVSFLQCWLDYKFYYEIWSYEDVERIFYSYTMPVWLYTVVSSVFIYILFRIVNHFLMPREHLTIEEVIKTS